MEDASRLPPASRPEPSVENDDRAPCPRVQVRSHAARNGPRRSKSKMPCEDAVLPFDDARHKLSESRGHQVVGARHARHVRAAPTRDKRKWRRRQGSSILRPWWDDGPAIDLVVALRLRLLHALLVRRGKLPSKV
jgi:hypothetical protein